MSEASKQPLAVVVLAAGRGSRMQSDLPKVLHPIGGAPMLHHVLARVTELEPSRLIVVTGHGAEAVAAAAQSHSDTVLCAHQAEQKGTAHAVLAAAPLLDDFTGNVLIVYGDTPLVPLETYRDLIDSDAKLALLAFKAVDPGRYGRVIVDGDIVDKVVEAKDASPEELQVKLCNSGVFFGEWPLVHSLLASVDNHNTAGEYYLTDIVALARASGTEVQAVRGAEASFLGVNSPQDLQAAEAAYQTARRAELIENGVYLDAPETLFCAFYSVIGRGARIEPYVVIGPAVSIESGAHIRAFSHLEGAHVSSGAVVGPYARLRPGTELAEHTRIGNFVEVKNAEIAEGAKVNHLSYIGDAAIGAGSNIGAGTITCNYDGVFKHRTEIGADVFIGSNTMLVAPLRVGDQAMTGSGSVITEDVASGDMAIARAKQVNKTGLGRRLMARLRSLKKG